MKREKFRQANNFIALFLVLFVLTCSPKSRLDGYLYYRLSYDPTTLDPARIVDVSGGSIAAKLFNGLVRLDEHLNIIPDIAERWKISEQGTLYVFYLKKGVLFTNGREVTASDFKYSFERILSHDSASPNTWVLDKISGAQEFMKGRSHDVAGIEAKDRYTLSIKLVESFSPFLNLLSMTAAYVVPREEIEKWGDDFSTYPIGTGPYKLQKWDHNNELIIERNNNYFERQTRIAGIVYRIIPEDLTAITEFEMSNLDVISIPASEYSHYQHSDRWKELISAAAGLNTYYLGFNCSRPPFNNLLLRLAVSYAIDRKKIFETFFEKKGRLAVGPVPDSLRTWDMPATNGYNPELSRTILKKTGALGIRINFYITAEREVIDIAEIIQSSMNDAGFDVRIKQLEWSAFKSAVNAGESDMFWLSWWADYADPENFLFPLFHSSNHGSSGNRTLYTNNTVDAYIESGQKAVDPKKSRDYYKEAEMIIVREVPALFFWHKNDFFINQPYIKNFRISPIYSIDKGTEVSF